MELDHDHYMDRAIALGLRKPRAPFGALVVAASSGEVLAEGVNSVEDSPTRHGEGSSSNHDSGFRASVP